MGLEQLFSPLLLAAILVIVVIAGFAHGALGFGFPLISTPLVTLLTDVRTAVLITVIPNIAINLFSILRGGNWRESIGRHWPLALWVVLGTLLGTQLLLGVRREPLQLLLAAMIVVFLNQDRLRRLDWSWIRRQPRLAAALFGITGGVLAGAVNVALPPLVIYLLTLELTPIALTQVLNLCFIAGKTVQAATLGFSGPENRLLLQASLPLLALAMLALYGGMRWQSRIGAESYHRLLRRALAVIAALLVGEALWALARA